MSVYDKVIGNEKLCKSLKYSIKIEDKIKFEDNENYVPDCEISLEFKPFATKKMKNITYQISNGVIHSYNVSEEEKETSEDHMTISSKCFDFEQECHIKRPLTFNYLKVFDELSLLLTRCFSKLLVHSLRAVQHFRHRP